MGGRRGSGLWALTFALTLPLPLFLLAALAFQQWVSPLLQRGDWSYSFSGVSSPLPPSFQFLAGVPPVLLLALPGLLPALGFLLSPFAVALAWWRGAPSRRWLAAPWLALVLPVLLGARQMGGAVIGMLMGL